MQIAALRHLGQEREKQRRVAFDRIEVACRRRLASRCRRRHPPRSGSLSGRDRDEAKRLRVLRVAGRNGYFLVLADYSRGLRAYYFRLPDGSQALQGAVPRQLEDCSPVRPGGYSRACFQVLGSPAAGFLPQGAAQLRFLVCRCLHHVLHAVKVVLPSEVRHEPSSPVVARLSVPFLLRVPDD